MANRERDRELLIPVDDSGDKDDGSSSKPSSSSAHHSIHERDLVSSHFDSGRPTHEEDVEDAFEVLHENDERVRTGIWVGDCFIYNNSSWKLNYCVGGEVTTMYHLDRPMYLLGYIANQSQVYLVDKEFKRLIAVINY